MREYAVSRTTAEWNRIMRQINGDPPMYRGRDELSDLAADIKQMLKYDNTVFDERVELPERIERM